MDSKTFFKLLKEYLISDLVSLENRIEGHGVFISEDPERYVKLEIDRKMFQDISIEEIEMHYPKYSFTHPGFYNEAYFQSLNYEEFLPYKNSFPGVASYFLDILENRIIDSFIEYFNFNLDYPSKSKIFVSKVSKELTDSIEHLKKRFSHEGYYKIYTYESFFWDHIITETMDEVLVRQIDLFDRLKEEYSTYLESTEQEKENSESKNKEDLIWYKIAKLIALGRLVYEEKKFIFDGKKFLSGQKTAIPVGAVIGEKANSVRPFLTETLSNSYSNSNNNIFHFKRLPILLDLMGNLPSDSISDFFNQKIKALENSTDIV